MLRCEFRVLVLKDDEAELQDEQQEDEVCILSGCLANKLDIQLLLPTLAAVY